MWMHLVNDDQRCEEDCCADGAERGQQHWHAPFVGEVRGDFDLERVVVVICYERAGEVGDD